MTPKTMTPSLATKIMHNINAKSGPNINISEAMSMKWTGVENGQEVFEFKKGTATFIAYVMHSEGNATINTKIL